MVGSGDAWELLSFEGTVELGSSDENAKNVAVEL